MFILDYYHRWRVLPQCVAAPAVAGWHIWLRRLQTAYLDYGFTAKRLESLRADLCAVEQAGCYCTNGIVIGAQCKLMTSRRLRPHATSMDKLGCNFNGVKDS